MYNVILLYLSIYFVFLLTSMRRNFHENLSVMAEAGYINCGRILFSVFPLSSTPDSLSGVWSKGNVITIHGAEINRPQVRFLCLFVVRKTTTATTF